MPTYDVIIAGYGPTGAVAANLLGALGMKVLVLDPNPEIYDIPRAVHIDGETMRIFQNLGLADEIAEVAAEASTLRFINGWNWTLVRQDMSILPRPNSWANDLFFNQPRLEGHLRKRVSGLASVQVRLGWALTDLEQREDGVEVQILEESSGVREQVHCSYLLACDGGGSPIRRLLQIELEDLQCDEPWLVCDLVLDPGCEFSRDVYQICDPGRPTTLVPCEETHIRWEFMLDDDDDVIALESDAVARSLMAPHMHRLSPTLNADSGTLIRSKVYNFHALLAETFRSERVFLLGDAAHQTPPFLGQGLCAGVRDSYNLCWKLAGVMAGQYPVSLLDTYTSERKPHVREVISTAVRHGAVIQTRNPVKALVRDCFLMLGRLFPPLVSFLGFGFNFKLGQGLLACDGAPAVDSPVGSPLPQPLVETAEGQNVRLDELLGGGFALVGIGVDPAIVLAELNIDPAGELPLNCVHIGLPGQMRDISGVLNNWATDHSIEIALVRPDRQVYGVCTKGSGVELRQQLAGLLTRLHGQLNTA
jgi:3-(3-hydroxy-phenyl)propionate hydroxylase